MLSHKARFFFFQGGGDFILYFFNWQKISLQCYIGFCPTAMQISHNYIHLSSLLREVYILPSSPSIPPLWIITGCPAGLPVLYSNFPLTISVLLHMIVYICQHDFLNSSHPYLPPHLVFTSPFSTTFISTLFLDFIYIYVYINIYICINIQCLSFPF